MSTNEDHISGTYNQPPLTIVLVVILTVCFFIGFFSIYLCKCIMESILHTLQLQHAPSGNLVQPSNEPPVNPGLDPKIVQSFPLFPYSSVKDYQPGKYDLECAICLSEFTDDDMLRLLTTCYHVFHQGCIDLWLESHKTCPVCRTELDPSQNSPEKSPVNAVIISPNLNENNEALQDSVSIAVRDQNDNEEDQMTQESGVSTGHQHDIIFSRSHSTGHSIIRVRPEEEHKYRLRLPEHMKVKIARRHNQIESCITFGELTRSKLGNSGIFREVSEDSSRDFSKS